MEAQEMRSILRIEEGTKNLEEAARTIVVKDDESLATADNFLKGVKVLQKEIDEAFDPAIAKAHEAHATAIAQKRKYEEPLKKAERFLKIQIGPYLVEKEKIRRAAAERARREKEEAERKMREEEKRKQEAARREEWLGKNEEAKKIRESPTSAIELKEQAIPASSAPEGTHIKKIWKWRLLDIKLVPREFLIVDSTKVTKHVQHFKEISEIPGIEAYSEDIVATRSK